MGQPAGWRSAAAPVAPNVGLMLDTTALRQWAGVQAPAPAAGPAAGAAAPGQPAVAPGSGAAQGAKGIAACGAACMASLQQAAQDLEEFAAAAEMEGDVDPAITELLGKCSEHAAELQEMLGGVVTRIEETDDEDDEADQEDPLLDDDDEDEGY